MLFRVSYKSMFYTPLSVFSLRNSVCRILNYVYMIHLKTIRVNPVQTEIMFFFQCQNVLISILPAHQKCSVIRLSEQINYTFQSILLCFKGVFAKFRQQISNVFGQFSEQWYVFRLAGIFMPCRQLRVWKVSRRLTIFNKGIRRRPFACLRSKLH